MAAWGVHPADVAQRFSEEALVELVPAMIERRARESVTYQLAQIAKAAGPTPASESVSARQSGGARVHRYPSGRAGRTYGSARAPLTGEALEAAVRDIGVRVGRGRAGRGPVQ